jgi:hypothetical protein
MFINFSSVVTFLFRQRPEVGRARAGLLAFAGTSPAAETTAGRSGYMSADRSRKEMGTRGWRRRARRPPSPSRSKAASWRPATEMATASEEVQDTMERVSTEADCLMEKYPLYCLTQ